VTFANMNPNAMAFTDTPQQETKVITVARFESTPVTPSFAKID
jgi:hypothetical protein